MIQKFTASMSECGVVSQYEVDASLRGTHINTRQMILEYANAKRSLVISALKKSILEFEKEFEHLQNMTDLIQEHMNHILEEKRHMHVRQSSY